ncbi:BREX-1 system adenine-specific DNA-methyltransferase PglX [Bacteroides ovatus]|uniref:BREX-1 system adenine-specific DNA-methyltransferase PglX n=4 Tax=Bacteroides ovatus TaxID=28116 RepID=UPI00202E3E4B|nr:BREX-1 system adenine-specific DNA-methyltransferase PglX [Bacteroides ovatus]MCM1720325.1 BREX-1 system adenine-specific DNA-methyltransferase PglX [Bacteroides ovatus]MCM1866310.1 BREX-1 system adenine-specific DNA-methyltransferase PglX [Bacteroides ovatus]
MKLIQHVLSIRCLIQQAFENRFERLGLKCTGEQPIETLPEERQEARRRLDNIIANHKESGNDYWTAREETIRECVFTLFNRIAAIKVMEDRELFPEIIRRRTEHAGRSFAHNAWLEEHPEERSAEREGLKHFLNDKFEELGVRLPIYKTDYPYALLPTADELFRILEAFNAVELDIDCGDDIWKGDDILGWMYENFNQVEKKAHKESKDDTEYDKVSLQSQFYTPKWVVKFLVDNTLVKQYLEMYPSSPLREKYQVANAPELSPFPAPGVTAKKVEELRLIDPACGSGNFLLYACGVFYDLYQDQVDNFGANYSRRDIPKSILENNLYGVDLDERAVQLTQLSLYIKAWQLGGRRMNFPKHLNVVSTAFTLPSFDNVKMALMMGDEWKDVELDTLRMVWNDLQNAYKFGSLIRVEETFDRLLPVDADDMFAHQWKQKMFSFKRIAIEKLRHQLANSSSNPYSLSKVNDAMTFLDILTNKFDVAVANPPYTDSADFGKELKEFIEENYKKPLKFNSNLYAAFIKRCCELATDGGKVGMVNPPTFMYIKTFEDLRKYLVEQMHIDTFVEWGYLGMFSPTARVDSAMFILNKGKRDDLSSFIKLNDLYEGRRYDFFVQAYNDLCTNVENDRVYHLPQSKLKEIKSYPFIYWISDEFRGNMKGKDLDKIVDIRAGIQTSNNNRFLRFWWEVDETNIYSGEGNAKWVVYSKGGPFNKWYGNLWLLIDWEENGNKLRKYLLSRGQDLHAQDYYYLEGITYSASGSKGMSFRYMPKDCLFDIGGSSIFCVKEFNNSLYLIGLLNSKLSVYLTNCFNPTVNKQPNDIKRIPFTKPDYNIEMKVSLLSKQCINIMENILNHSIIYKDYVGTPIGNGSLPQYELNNYYSVESGFETLVLLNESVINNLIFEVYDLSAHDRQMVLDKEDIPVGYYSVSAQAKESYKEWLSSNTKFPVTLEVLEYIESLEINDSQSRIDDFESLYQNNNRWEVFCNKHKMNPIEVWYQFKNVGVLPAQRTQILAFELITDVIRSVLAKDDDGMVPIIDRTGEEQLAVRIEAELIERKYQPAHISSIFNLLDMPLDKYLQSKFFQQLSDHLNLFMYLPKTPFIWHISSGEHHALELYVSIYKWSRDNCYRLKSVYAGNRDSALRDRLSVLEGQNDVASKMEADEIRLQLRELAAFCDKIDDLLASGYDPKLDDGVGKNIAPLQKRKMLSYEVLNSGQLKKYLNADW